MLEKRDASCTEMFSYSKRNSTVVYKIVDPNL